MDDLEKNFNRALRFLSFRPRSEKEIVDYLKKKTSYSKAQEEEKENLEIMISAIVGKLKEHRFINDKEFARIWISQRTKIKPRALRIIKRELAEKGIDKETIDELLVNSENEVPSDFQMAYTLAEKRLKKYKDLPKQEFFEKMGRYLASRGFTYDIIKEVIGKIG
jgi:regulatory protein